MARSKYTVRDIAKLAGVSPATVSRVMNHPELVDTATAQKVQAAIKELGYIVKATHSPAVSQKDLILINCVPGTNPFYSDVVSGAYASAGAHGYDLAANFDSINASTIENFISFVKRIHASGVITLSHIREDILKQINDVVPLIQCCEYNPESAVPYVSIDDYTAAQQAVNYLINAGRSKIAIVNGPLQYKYARDRLRAFQDTMESAGLFVPSSWILQIPDINYEMAYTIVSQLLSSESRPNAFFAVSDVLAAAVINAARKYKIRVPEDIMVMGFDNIPLCQMTRPTISTVSQPKFQLGYTACEYLIENIKNNGLAPRSILLSTDIVIREST